MDESGRHPLGPSPSQIRGRACEAVQAVVSDDHNYERGVESARAVAQATLAEFGPVGLAELMVRLSLELASALERIAGEHEMAAADLATVWFVD